MTSKEEDNKTKEELNLNKNQEKKQNENQDEKDIENNLEVKYEELEDKYTRLLAEFENFKKRTNKEVVGKYQTAKVSIIKSMLPIIDALDNSKTFDTKDENFKEGIEQIHKQFESFLKQNLVEEIKTVGEKFDPEIHEAITTVEGEEEDIITSELRKGYKMGSQIIRHAMVIVTKNN